MTWGGSNIWGKHLSYFITSPLGLVILCLVDCSKYVMETWNFKEWIWHYRSGLGGNSRQMERKGKDSVI